MTITESTVDAPAVARTVLDALEAAWNSADGTAFGAQYTPDASFVTVRGEHVVGREAIAAGHHGIFTTIYAGSQNRMELISAAELADGVILMNARATLDCPAGPLTGRHQALSTNLLVCTGGRWLLQATQNTLITG